MRSLFRSCCALAAAVSLALILSASQTAAASTFVVNSNADTPDAAPGTNGCADANGVCTLRAAVQEANALAGDDIINFSISGTINLTAPSATDPSTALVVNSNITINAPAHPA